MLIYINRNGQQLGSFTIEKINLGLASGQFLPTDLAFYEGLPQWTQLNNIQGVAIPTVAPIVPPASQAPLPRRPWYSILFIVCGCIGIPLSIIAFVVLANERPRIENIVLAIVFPLGTLGSFFFAWLTKKTNEVTEYLRHLANK